MTRFKFLVGLASSFRGAIGVTTKIFLRNKPSIYPYNATLSVMLEPMILLWQVFPILQKNIFKKQYYVINFMFKKIVKKQKKINFLFKTHHNCLQYERVLKILYFHVLNIAKFG